MTINNVQSNGGAHWVALYFANGDSTYRNVTVRCAPSPSPNPAHITSTHTLGRPVLRAA